MHDAASVLTDPFSDLLARLRRARILIVWRLRRRRSDASASALMVQPALQGAAIRRFTMRPNRGCQIMQGGLQPTVASRLGACGWRLLRLG